MRTVPASSESSSKKLPDELPAFASTVKASKVKVGTLLALAATYVAI